MKNPIQLYRNLPLMVKVTLVFALASFATSGINYVTTPIFTRILSKEQYGLVSVYNSWYSIIQVFASLTLIFPGILNVGLYNHKENMWKYLSSMLGITTICSAALGILYLLFFNTVNRLFNLPPNLVILMLILCFLSPATTFWTFRQRYHYDYKIAFIVSVGSALFAQIAAVVAVLWAKHHGFNRLADVRLWSAGLVNCTVALILFITICIRGKTFIDLPLWKTTFWIALPLIPHYIGSVVLSSTDKIMIDRMVGADKAGIYSLAAILSAIGVLLWRALSITFAPFINTKLHERNFKQIQTTVKPLLIVIAILCVIASMAAPELILLLAHKDYLIGMAVVPPIAAGIFIHALYDIFSAVSFFHKRSTRIMTATLIAAGCNIVLNYIFIPRFGFIAAGYTTLISNLVLTGMHYWNMRVIEHETVYDPKFCLLLLILTTLGCLSANILYTQTVVRYLSIVILFFVMMTLHKKLAQSLIDMKV